MKKLLYKNYGTPQVLYWEDVPEPAIKNDEVLIKIMAASINPTDTKMRAGDMKFMTALMGHFPFGMGLDFAGVISKVGSDVTKVKIGDKVFGGTMSPGTFADYFKSDADKVTLMPDNLTFEEACTISLNGGTAMATAMNYVHPKPGLNVLINGASGGVGLFLMQICVAYGATTSASCGPESVAQLQSLGATNVYDYINSPVLNSAKEFDIIVDCSGKMDFDQACTILSEHGTFCTLTPGLKSIGEQIGNIFRSKKEKNVMSMPSEENMADLMQLIQQGKVKCVIGEVFSMNEAIEVQEKLESSKLKITGKVVLLEHNYSQTKTSKKMTKIKVNGQEKEILSPSDTPLLWVLRDELNMTGTKYGCGHGVCGCCIVNVDGAQMHACKNTVADVQGKNVTTIEGQQGKIADAIFAAWKDNDVAQCGFCQPGQINSASVLLAHNTNPTDEDIDDAMKHNLCRCSTYVRVRKAIKEAAASLS